MNESINNKWNSLFYHVSIIDFLLQPTIDYCQPTSRIQGRRLIRTRLCLVVENWPMSSVLLLLLLLLLHAHEDEPSDQTMMQLFSIHSEATTTTAWTASFL
jgi:hypothetical protein